MTVVKISELPQKDALEDGDKVIAWNSANGATSVLLGTAFTAIKEASATSASAAKASENAAKNLASEASSSADSASESASGAALSAEAAKASETNALASANSASASQTQIESDIAQAKLDIKTERTAAVSAVEAAQATAISSIQTQGTESVTAVTDAQATSVSAVKAQETASIQAIEADSVLAGYAKKDELFGNDGAGPTLRTDILPAATADTPGAVTTGDGITNNNGKLTVDFSAYTKKDELSSLLAAAVTQAVTQAVAEAKLSGHPVGSYYWSSESTDPSALFGGTWEQVKDRFVLAAGDSYAVGATGGEPTHTLTEAEMPAHKHYATDNSTSQGSNSFVAWGSDGAKDWSGMRVTAKTWGSASGYTKEQWGEKGPDMDNQIFAYQANRTTSSTGGGAAHNNMPPYIVAFCWKRTA